MMKKIFVLLILSGLFIACGSQNSQNTESTNQETSIIDPANLQTIEIAVYGMTCGGCEKTVQTAVSKLPGVQEVKASFKDSTAIVTYDKSKANFEEIKKAIIAKGYEPHEFNVIK